MRFLLKSLLSGFIAASAVSSADALIVGTFNVRYDASSDAKAGNGWEQRLPVISQLIKFHQFDVLGTQEALHHQIEGLQEQLPEFSHVGVGRDDGEKKGEFAAIFYKKDKLRLLDSGTFWLSPTPEKIGVKGWDAALPRVCTWAKFEEIDEKHSFWVFNVHFDHQGVEARLESTRLVLRKIEEKAGDEPVIFTGDFNVNQTSESYREILASERFTDAYETAGIRYAFVGTANSFNPNASTDSRIDHVFLTEHFKPLRYGILTDSYRGPAAVETPGRSGNFPAEVVIEEQQARLPSDHFPVLVEVEWTAE